MKIETITVMERKNLGNYEHIEITASAKVEENDDAYSSLLTLKTLVHAALEGKAATEVSNGSNINSGEGIKKESDNSGKDLASGKVNEVIVPDIGDKPKTTRSKKEAKKEKAPVSDETSNIPAIPVEEVQPVGKNVEVYNSNLAEHKSIFAGYLAKKYDNSWKTAKPVDEIKSFTASLNGKHFLDNDGKIVESFLNLVHEFFGA